jgi:hypothetical protein
MSDQQRARELFDSFAASSSRSSRDLIAADLFQFFKAPFADSSIGTQIVDWCLERCVDESATLVSRNASIWFLTELDGNSQNSMSSENRERIFRRLFNHLCQEAATCAEPMFDLMASLCVDGDEEGMLCQPIIEFVLSEIRVVATCNCVHQSNRSCAVARRVDTVLNLIRLLAETLAACSTDDDIYQALHEFAANPTVRSILQIGSDLLQQHFSTHMDSEFVWHGTRLFLLTAFEPSLRFVIEQLPKVGLFCYFTQENLEIIFLFCFTGTSTASRFSSDRTSGAIAVRHRSVPQPFRRHSGASTARCLRQDFAGIAGAVSGAHGSRQHDDGTPRSDVFRAEIQSGSAQASHSV